ncbi:hypothetical protein ACN24K_30015 [Streptomyces microflavus]
MNKETASRRFGPDFVAEQRAQRRRSPTICAKRFRRYGKRPPESRMLSYDLAVLDEYEPWRFWLDEQLDLLLDTAADVFAANPWRDQNFWPDIIELAAGDALRRKGLAVELERNWEPDTGLDRPRRGGGTGDPGLIGPRPGPGMVRPAAKDVISSAVLA